MQNLELENKTHEFRDLIGRDAEWVLIDNCLGGATARFRGPITRVISTIDPLPNPERYWRFAVSWIAVMDFPFTRKPKEKWELLNDKPRFFEDEEDGYLSFPGGSFTTAELIEQTDGILVGKIKRTGLRSMQLIIHRSGDNLALESVIAP